MDEIAVSYDKDYIAYNVAVPLLRLVLDNIGQELVRNGEIEQYRVPEGPFYNGDYSLENVNVIPRKFCRLKRIETTTLVSIQTHLNESRSCNGIINRIEVFDKRVESFLSKYLPIYYNRFNLLEKSPPRFIRR